MLSAQKQPDTDYFLKEIRQNFECLNFNTMTNIYKETIEAVESGARFSIDFQERSLKVNGKYIINKGEFGGTLGIQIPVNPLGEIEKFYRRYLHSIPSERSLSKKSIYFRALPERELGDEDMLYGIPREVAQVILELYTLCAILQNKINWDDFAAGKWFWQSPNEPSLILLKQWFTNN